MPIKILTRGLVYGPSGQVNLPTMEHKIVLPVIEFHSDAAADRYVKLWRYGQVSPVEELMHITPEEHSVSDIMRAAFGIRLDMGCFQDREYPFLRDGTGSPVSICDHNLAYEEVHGC